MFDDCECEMCGVPGTKTVRGIILCDICDPEEDGADEMQTTPDGLMWPQEISYGLIENLEQGCESLTQ